MRTKIVIMLAFFALAGCQTAAEHPKGRLYTPPVGMGGSR